MKLILIISLFILIPSQISPYPSTEVADSGWVQQAIPTTNNLNCIYFSSSDSGWISGNGGIIFSTTDSGNNWLLQQSNTTFNLNSVKFVNNLYGWAAGQNGTLLLTTNGGINWETGNSGTTENLKSIFFINQTTGWASGNNGTIIKSTDGGLNWSAQTPPDNDNYESIFFVNQNLGVAVDDQGFIIRTGNGGSTWGIAPSYPYRPLYSVFFTDESNGYTAGDYYVIKRTTNSGDIWTYLTEDDSKYLRSVHFIHPSTGWIVGLNGVILKTTNYGDSWEEYSSGTASDLYSVFFTDILNGWAVGEGGTLLKYISPNKIITVLSPNGGENIQAGLTFSIEWISEGIDELKIEYTTDDGTAWNLIAPSVPASDQNFQWEVPNTPTLEGRIKLSDASIETVSDISDSLFAISSEQLGWFKLQFNAGFSLFSIYFVNENLGWAVGNSGNILKTTDGGNNWTTQNSGSNDYLLEIEFVNQNTGWVIGADGIIRKTTNGGSYWFAQGSLSDFAISCSFVNENDGWILSYEGRIYHTSNGGNNWTLQYQLPDGYYYTIEFVNNQEGFIGSNLIPLNESVIYKTTDGGQSWFNSYFNIGTPGVKSLSFADENNGFGVGIHGVIMRTVTGGQNWLVLTQGFNNWLNSVKCITGNMAWAVGTYGTILHTSNGMDWYSQISGTSEIFHSIYMVDSLTGYIAGEDGNIYKTNSGGFIPVELENLQGYTTNNEVTLIWNTASETNNKGFEVERSVRSKEYAVCSLWEMVGFVSGNGTTTGKHYYSYTDKNVYPGKYVYRLKQIDYDGSFEYSKEVELNVDAPLRFNLGQNYPNPFNPVTTINYQLPANSFVRLEVYNLLGEKVATLVNEEKPAGSYEVKFDGGSLPSGVYIYRLTAGSYSAARKLVLVK